jgi:hypothetical protein
MTNWLSTHNELNALDASINLAVETHETVNVARPLNHQIMAFIDTIKRVYLQQSLPLHDL